MIGKVLKDHITGILKLKGKSTIYDWKIPLESSAFSDRKHIIRYLENAIVDFQIFIYEDVILNCDIVCLHRSFMRHFLSAMKISKKDSAYSRLKMAFSEFSIVTIEIEHKSKIDSLLRYLSGIDKPIPIQDGDNLKLKVNGSKKRSRSYSSSNCENSGTIAEGKWSPGTILEGEILSDDDYYHYHDCIHPVEVTKYNPETKLYLCQMLAFDEKFDWKEEELHIPRNDDGTNKTFYINDKVHIRIRNRRVNRTEVDGLLSEQGIWVKGVIVKKHKYGDFDVQHTAWRDNGGVKVTRVSPKDIRSPY